MQEPQHTPIRHQSGYNVLPSSPAGSTVAASPASVLLKSICSKLGGWVQGHQDDTAADYGSSTDQHLAESAQSIGQVLEGMGTWALQAAALNICLPSSGWNRPDVSNGGSSRCSSLSPMRQRHPMQPPSNGRSRNSSERDLAVKAAQRDTSKTPGEIECTKHHFLDTTVKQFTSETPVAHTPAPSPPAPAAADDSTSRDSQMAADNERMQRELLCLQASLGALFVTCHTLTEENHRLRVVADAGNDDFLSDALEQLLREKNALQQEVVNLKQQNKSLQELLEYTAPPEAPSVSEGPSWAPAAYEGGGSSNFTGVPAATPMASVCGNATTPWASYGRQVLTDGLCYSSMVQQSSVGDLSQRHQPQECFGYYLATPTGSVAESSCSGTSGRVSPVEIRSVPGSAQRQEVGKRKTVDSNTPGVTTPPDQQGQLQLARQHAVVEGCAGQDVALDAARLDFCTVPAGDGDDHDAETLHKQRQRLNLDAESSHAVLRPLQLGRHAGKQQQLRLDTSGSTVICVSGVLSSPGCVATEKLMASSVE